MAITKSCEFCFKPISGRIRANTKYCSKLCGNRAKSKARIKDDVIKECLNCQSSFAAKYSVKKGNDDNLTRFCSNKCAREHKANSNKEYVCECCNVTFKISPSVEAKSERRFCSADCAKSFLREENSPAYKTGSFIHSDSGKRMILVSGKDASNDKREVYVAESRLVAAKAVGRPLLTSEVVVHLNEDPLDVQESNLMICDIGTARKIKRGTYKLEVKSNLDTYR